MKALFTVLTLLVSPLAHAYEFEIGETIYITEPRWVNPLGTDRNCMLMPVQNTEVVAIQGDQITMELIDGREPYKNGATGDCLFGTRFDLPAHLADTLRAHSNRFYTERLEMLEILSGRSPTKQVGDVSVGNRYTFRNWQWLNIEARTRNSNRVFEVWDLCRALPGETLKIEGFVLSTKKALARYEFKGMASFSECPDKTLFLVPISDLQPAL